MTMRDRAALWTTVGAASLIGFWEAFVRVRDVRPFVLLPPSRIVSTFFDTPGFFLEATARTAWHLAIGLAIS
ncbi:MAG: hypothetical protein HKN41_05285, partial [Ilumatobacter sp.]|nr:hypothetical protein [Ilumatobacter sp.]